LGARQGLEVLSVRNPDDVLESLDQLLLALESVIEEVCNAILYLRIAQGVNDLAVVEFEAEVGASDYKEKLTGPAECAT